MNQRNSNIELMRLVAMFCIVFHHFIDHNVDDVTVLGDTPTRYLLESCGTLVGKISVCLFFIISIWFLADRRLTVRESCRRVWILEREILFYSVGCYLVYSLMMGVFSPTQLLARLLPVLTGEWWFVSDYVLLMLAMPFLLVGLKSLSQRDHAVLAAAMTVFFGFVQYLPYIGWALSDGSGILGILMLTIVVCYCRWHGEELLPGGVHSRRLPMASAIAVVLLTVLYASASMLHVPVLPSIAGKLWTPMQDWHSLLVIVISVTVFLWTNSAKPHHWPLVNRMAASAFAIYLITDAPEAETLLWARLFPLSDIAHSPIPVLLSMLLITAGLCLVGILIDQVRTVLFRWTVNRRPGAWFDRLTLRLGR